MNVAIVGIGIHPFGRHPGVSGLAQGAYAARQALADAGIGWADVECAFGGSMAAGNADTLVSDLGLTGLPFINVHNGCATGGSALAMADRAIRSGDHDLVMAVGFDKHPPGAFNADPEESGLGRWYGETGLMLTTQFFGMKIQRYMHEYGISAATLAKVAAKAFRNGARNPHAWRRQPLTEAGDRRLADGQPPADQVHVLLARRGRRGAGALPRRPGPPLHQPAGVPVGRVAAAPGGSARSRCSARGSPPARRADGAARAPRRRGRPSKRPGSGRRTSDVLQLQDTESGAEIMHMAETGFCKDGEQEALIHDGATEIGGTMPVNTDGGCLANGEPIGASGLRQVYESVLQLRGAAGDRQVPGEPKVAFTHVYGAPGISSCAVLTR